MPSSKTITSLSFWFNSFAVLSFRFNSAVVFPFRLNLFLLFLFLIRYLIVIIIGRLRGFWRNGCHLLFNYVLFFLCFLICLFLLFLTFRFTGQPFSSPFLSFQSLFLRPLVLYLILPFVLILLLGPFQPDGFSSSKVIVPILYSG